MESSARNGTVRKIKAEGLFQSYRDGWQETQRPLKDSVPLKPDYGLYCPDVNINS